MEHSGKIMKWHNELIEIKIEYNPYIIMKITELAKFVDEFFAPKEGFR